MLSDSRGKIAISAGGIIFTFVFELARAVNESRGITPGFFRTYVVIWVGKDNFKSAKDGRIEGEPLKSKMGEEDLKGFAVEVRECCPFSLTQAPSADSGVILRRKKNGERRKRKRKT